MRKFLLILSLFASLSVEAQYVTTFAKNAPETQEDGILYYLPRNVIVLEFTIEETNYYIGPYAEFASRLLGISDFVKENKTEYSIKDVDIQLTNEIDPNAVYFISADEKSKEPFPNVILDTDGVILAFGHDNIPTNQTIKRESYIRNESNNIEKQEVTFLEILDNEIEFDDDDDDEEEGRAPRKITKEDKAKAALDKISKIRTAYYELISGFNEVSYGNTTSYMADNMKSLENEYISLFKGKIIKSTYKQTMYFTPDEKQANASVSITKIAGEQIKLQFESKNQLANINPVNDETKTTSQSNKLFYRMPVETTLKVLSGNNVIAEKQLVISQFGVLRVISVKNNKVLFNPNTGQITTILK